VAVASAGSDEDLRPPEQREVELAEAMMMQDKHWTEKELRENKERLAKLLNDAFKTTGDKPHLYTPVAGDTAAVKKIKQEIRARMRQIRGEQLAREYEPPTEPIHQDVSKHKELCSDTPGCIANSANKESDTAGCIPSTVSKHDDRLAYETIVLMLSNQLSNGVQTERDLQTCAQLAEHNVTRETLEQHINQYGSDTVTQLGARILGTTHI
jgi:DNA-binding phage protein